MSGLLDLVDRISAEKEATQAAITHVAMGPTIPPEPEYQRQRYFSRGPRNLSYSDVCISKQASLVVYRSARDDSAQIRFETLAMEGDNVAGRMQVSVDMGPGHLRALAMRLLDAAHDLDTYPSAVLMAGDPRVGAIVESES